MTQDEIEAAVAFQRHEMGGDSAEDRRWYRWLKAAESIAVLTGGFRNDPKCSPLDGDEPSGDTYSLDSAYEAWRAGVSPGGYVAHCATRMGARP